MKIKSTVEKMHNYGLINFSKTPDNPFDKKGEVNKPIIAKKEFRKLQIGQEITVNEKQFTEINERFPGLLEDIENESGAEAPKPENDQNITLDE